MSIKSAIVTSVTVSVTLELDFHALRLEHKAAVDDIADERGHSSIFFQLVSGL
jgi:hypothetical protein